MYASYIYIYIERERERERERGRDFRQLDRSNLPLPRDYDKAIQVIRNQTMIIKKQTIGPITHRGFLAAIPVPTT